MGLRTIDLSGTYTIHAVDGDSIMLVDPVSINPAWAYADLDGAGTTGYGQNIRLIVAGVNEGVDLAGTYEIASVTATEIELVNPAGVNADWGLLSLFEDGRTRLLSSYVAKTAGNWIGPFIVDGDDTSLLVANFVAMQGLLKDNGKKQKAFPVTVELEATPVDEADTPIGPPQTFTTTISGNAKGRDMRAATLVCELDTPGRQSVRARRTTPGDYDYEGTVADEVKWQDLYGMAAVGLSDFGDVTTVHSRTYATEGALSVKERQLSALVTRKLEVGTSGGLVPTTNAADIFIAACLDPFIGGRTNEEIDTDAIYEAVQAAVDYFGVSEAGGFAFTFDNDKISFEETAATIAQACFCTAFRQGSTIRLAFERATEDSVLLFNHRNKLPGSETRSVRFGNLDDNDGIELEYRDPDDDAAVTIYIPADRSATNAREVKVPGVRSTKQAFWHAWRAWNKVRYQNTAVEFTALQEAAAISRNERILVADNTRPDTMDGEVVGQSGLELETSQPSPLDPYLPYTAFLQLPDGSIDAIAASRGSSDRHIVLARAPRLALALGEDLYARATYEIVPDESTRERAFLLAEKDAEDNFTYRLRAINYSALYYQHDQLILWLEFANAFLDSSPYLRHGTAVGAATTVVDADRQEVYSAGAASDGISLADFDMPASYTKMAWIKITALASAAYILSSAAEHFGVLPGLTLAMGHAGDDDLSALWPSLGTWHHAAATYDEETGEAALFIDGEIVATGDIVARAAVAVEAIGIGAVNGLNGRADDLRLYRRALLPAEIREIFRATRA